MSLVKRATTASFGIAKERIPGQKAAIVYLMTFCWFSRLRVLKCRPLPDAAAALDIPRLTKAQTLLWSAPCSLRCGLSGTDHCQYDEVVIKSKFAVHLEADKQSSCHEDCRYAREATDNGNNGGSAATKAIQVTWIRGHPSIR